MGECRRNKDSVVVYQDSQCVEVCGRRLGSKCQIGCQKLLAQAERSENAKRVHHFRVSKFAEKLWPNHSNPIELVVVDQPDGAITLLVEDSEKQPPVGLTPSETRIYTLKVIQKCSHKEICESLFISRATLRTHLNNISRKLYRVAGAHPTD